MGYQALLFCPDEKTARTVTQVLSELDFAVIACTEPFAAVKKLMAESFDAVVVDCDNEQNATLLFKSARNAPNNQSSLAVAVVEGQVGVAKAFRIGANLVLTKPINVEQAKGTLRVARGLLRKGEAAKTGATAAAAGKPVVSKPPKPAASTSGISLSRPASAPPAMPSFPVSPTTSRPMVRASSAAAGAESVESGNEGASSSSPLKSTTQIPLPKISATSSPAPAESGPGKAKTTSAESSTPEPFASAPTTGLPQKGFAGFGSASASAPAPARETAPEDKPVEIAAVPENSHETAPLESSSASTLTFGGAAGSDAEAAPGPKSRKPIIAVAAILLLAISGYLAWTQLGGKISLPFHFAPNSTAPTAAMPRVAPAPAPVTKAAPVVPPASSVSPTLSSPLSSAPPADETEISANAATTVKTEKARVAPSSPNVMAGNAPADSAKPAASVPMANKAPSTGAAAHVVVKKSEASRLPSGKLPTATDAPAPSLAGITPAGGAGVLPDLESAGTAPVPVLQTMSVSQGVSQGLVLKRVQPAYPANALHMQVEGPVELLATISKAGNVSAVKVLGGDPQLARAAVDAVKQWKYKPYLLNGQPVEIQTQITVKFKLPR